MSRILFGFSLVVALLTASTAEADGAPKEKGALPKKKAAPKKDTVEELMRRKLTNAQKALEGIATNDYDKIVKHAEELIEISRQARWKVMKTPVYELYSMQFREGAEAMVKSAKRKNVEGAALGYVDLTLTCVKCHKHVREKRVARAE
jgi:hypothetical protein